MSVDKTTTNGVQNGDVPKINEDLYSRQLYTLGKSAMLEMRKTKVLISGMGGLGVEIAKNVILAGVKEVCVHDVTATTISDLSTQYYLTKPDIGKKSGRVLLGEISRTQPRSDCEMF